MAGLQLNAQPSLPRFQSFQPVSLKQSHSQQPPHLFAPGNPILGNNSIDQRNMQLMQQGGMNLPGPTHTQQSQVAELKRFTNEEKTEEFERYTKQWTDNFQNYVQEFLKMNPDSFSITKAVYLSEAAYYEKPYSYAEFEKAIQQSADLVKQVLKAQKLDYKNDLAANYGIQKLYTQQNTFYDSKKGKYFTTKKLGYDFDDYNGEKDWSKMFVTKLLQTGKGQCHSLPLLYLCIAEKLDARAYLSLAPNHSFIQFFDAKGNRYNFEATNGNLVTQTWLMQSSYINATAVKNNTYLDTLDHRRLYAQCLGDLLMAYEARVGDNAFTEQLIQQVLAIDPDNITALMTQSNINTYRFRNRLQSHQNPPQNEWNNYPDLKAAYESMMNGYQKIEATGFQEMPVEAYQKWLKTIEKEKQSQRYKEQQEKLKKQIEFLKNKKPVFINSPKG